MSGAQQSLSEDFEAQGSRPRSLQRPTFARWQSSGKATDGQNCGHPLLSLSCTRAPGKRARLLSALSALQPGTLAAPHTHLLPAPPGQLWTSDRQHPRVSDCSSRASGVLCWCGAVPSRAPSGEAGPGGGRGPGPAAPSAGRPAGRRRAGREVVLASPRGAVRCPAAAARLGRGRSGAAGVLAAPVRGSGPARPRLAGLAARRCAAPSPRRSGRPRPGPERAHAERPVCRGADAWPWSGSPAPRLRWYRGGAAAGLPPATAARDCCSPASGCCCSPGRPRAPQVSLAEPPGTGPPPCPPSLPRSPPSDSPLPAHPLLFSTAPSPSLLEMLSHSSWAQQIKAWRK